MRRRTYLRAFAGAAASAAVAPSRAAASCTVTDLVPPIEAFDTSSLLAADHGPLDDPSVVALWAAKTATNSDADGNGDAYLYADDAPVPLVAVDGNVVGFGSMLVADADANFEYGNEEFLLNVWDDVAGGGTVLWDEGHGQYWTLDEFSRFESYAESNGYDVRPTADLAADLPSADAAVVTSPGAFSTAELDALASFVADGGALFLHDQSDYSDYDETANLDAIADHLGLAFRFNDDEVTDAEHNDGDDYEPVTDEFNTDFPFFADRDGLALEKEESYDVTVTSVTDGDTVDVEFPDGSGEEVRVLGIDTPETRRNSKYERIQEWEGIEDDKYLADWGGEASDYATAELEGESVTLHFDENEPVRDAFGRVLGYITYDADGDGSRDTLYNRAAVEDGYARVYGSSLTKHESIRQAEADARAAGRGVWQASDPDDSGEIRDRAVDDLFFPVVSSVRTSSGAVADARVPVYAESTATQQLDGGVDYADPPLVAVDETNRVGVVGGLTINEAYESDEGFGADTADFENFVFLTNLVDYLSDRTGDVLIDGGHGQFGHEYSLSSEDAAYYGRYLEGQDVAFSQTNEVTTAALSRGRAIVVTSPVTCFTSSEVDALSSFVDDGGAVVLMGSARTEDLRDRPRTNLNDLAAGLGSDLRLNEDQVFDDASNVDDDPAIPTTAAFDRSFPLFDRYS